MSFTISIGIRKTGLGRAAESAQSPIAYGPSPLKPAGTGTGTRGCCHTPPRPFPRHIIPAQRFPQSVSTITVRGIAQVLQEQLDAPIVKLRLLSR